MRDDRDGNQLLVAAEELVDVLDGGFFGDRGPHGTHEPGRQVALDERAAGADLVHQLVHVLDALLDHVVMLAVVDHVHYRSPPPGEH